MKMIIIIIDTTSKNIKSWSKADLERKPWKVYR